jgi:peptide/nickel transport system ATP-binding protein
VSVSATPILEIAGLTIGLPRGADRAHAVQGIDLAVATHEIVCQVGETG